MLAVRPHVGDREEADLHDLALKLVYAAGLQ